MKLKIPWDKFRKWFGIIGVPLAIIFWLTDKYYFVDKPEITFTVLSNESVFSVSDTVQGLNISYAEVNLLEENLNLSVLVVRIQNTGSETIGIDNYDRNSALAFKITNGRLLPLIEIVNSSDREYFSDVLLPEIDENGLINPNGYLSGRVRFSPKILNKGDFFDVKCLVIHSPENIPEIEPQGKVAGVKNFQKAILENVVEDPTAERSFIFIASIVILFLTLTMVTYFLYLVRRRNDSMEQLQKDLQHKANNHFQILATLLKLNSDNLADPEFREKFLYQINRIMHAMRLTSESDVESIIDDLISPENDDPESKNGSKI